MSTYLPGFLRPEWGSALRLHSLRRPGGHLWPYVDGASLLSRDFIDFLCKPRNISLFLSSIPLSFIHSPTPFLLRVPLDPAGAGPQQFYVLVFWPGGLWLAPTPGLETTPPASEGEISTTGPLGKSPLAY